jgi:predicted MFS family arabinose efflux permease
LAVLSACNQFDRQLTSVLLEPIRHDFVLSDIELGLLSGLAFAVLYAVLSLPAAIWAVRTNRRNLIVATAAVWGTMTALFGLSQSYWTLLASRLGVGLGEAGAMPASHAVISDLYGPHERGGALATWSAGVNIGIFLAFLLGGAVGQMLGWRIVFLGAGLVTIVMAAVAATIAEPVRALDVESERWRKSASRALIAETARRMVGDVPVRHILIGSALTAVVGYGDIAWAASFFVRVHGLSLAAAGLYLAIVVGLFGALGTLLGGRLVDRLQRRHAAWGFGAIAAAYLIVKPFGLICYLGADKSVALAVYVAPALVGTLFVGPALATAHNRIAPTLRPATSALFLMIVNLIGLGIGPALVGVMSQLVFAPWGAYSVGYAMAAMQLIGLWGCIHFFVAGRRLGAEVGSVSFGATSRRPGALGR